MKALLLDRSRGEKATPHDVQLTLDLLLLALLVTDTADCTGTSQIGRRVCLGGWTSRGTASNYYHMSLLLHPRTSVRCDDRQFA
jgi:hypothetical protein